MSEWKRRLREALRGAKWGILLFGLYWSLGMVIWGIKTIMENYAGG